MEEQFDKDFDRLFARDLKTAGSGEQVRGEDWAALSARLDVAAGPGYRRHLPWLLLLLLLLSNGWWAWYRQSPAPRTAADAVVLIDTMRQTVVLYDTVWRTISVDRLSQATATKTEPFATAAAVQADTHAAALPVASMTQRPTKDLSPVVKSSTTETAPPTIATSATGHPANSRPIESVAAAPAAIIASDSTAVAAAETRDARANAVAQSDTDNARFEPRSPDSLLQVQPEALQPAATLPPPIKRHRYRSSWLLGLAGGLPTAFVKDDLALREAKVAQLQLIYRFGRHWSATASVLWQGYHYEQEHHFGRYPGFDLPPAPGQGYVLDQLESDAVDMLPGISLQYHLWPDRRYSAYLGVGYALRLSRLDDTNLEYRQSGTGLLYRQELPEHIWAKGSAVALQGGVNWQFKQRWTIWGGLEGWAEPGHWRRTVPSLSLLAGIKYRIK